MQFLARSETSVPILLWVPHTGRGVCLLVNVTAVGRLCESADWPYGPCSVFAEGLVLMCARAPKGSRNLLPSISIVHSPAAPFYSNLASVHSPPARCRPRGATRLFLSICVCVFIRFEGDVLDEFSIAARIAPLLLCFASYQSTSNRSVRHSLSPTACASSSILFFNRAHPFHLFLF